MFLQEPRLALEKVRSQELLKNHQIPEELWDCSTQHWHAFSFQVKSIMADLEDKHVSIEIDIPFWSASCIKTGGKDTQKMR